MSDPYSRKPATADYVLREGDTGPALDATLRDLDGSTVDLTNVTEVRLYVKHQATDELVVNTEVTSDISDAANGEVSVEFDSGFATTGAGMHELYFRVEFDSGSIETYPRGGVAYLWVPENFGTGDLADLDPADAEVGILTVTGRIDMQGNDINNAGTVESESLVLTDSTQ